MADQAESSRRALPMTPPPSPPFLEDSNSEAMLWAASDDCSSSTPHTDLISLWLSNYTTLLQSEAEVEPLADVPTLLNFDLQSSFPELVDWNTTSAAVTRAPAVTQPLWVQLHDSAAGEVDDLSRLALGIQSPKASILPLAPRIQDPEAFVSPLALGIQPPPSSSKIVAPQASFSPLALGLHSPTASFGMQPPQAPISPLARAFGTESSILPLARGIQFPEASISPLISPLVLGIQSPQISFEIQSAPASFSSLPPIPCTLPMAPPLWYLPSILCTLPEAPPLWNLPSITCTAPMAPPLWNLPSVPCTLPVAPPLWNLTSVPCTLPMAPPLWNFLPSSSPVPERRSWSVFPSTPPPVRQQLLFPHSASASLSSSSSHPSHQPHHFFPAANPGYHHQMPVAHASVTFSTPNANANFSAGFVPASRPSWSQAMALRGSWTPNQPWISSGQDMKLPIPRRPRFLLPPAAAAMPAPPPLLANFGSSVGNMPSWNTRRDVPVEDHQRDQTGESSRPRKRSKLTLDDPSDNKASHSTYYGVEVGHPSDNKASHPTYYGAEVGQIAREIFVPERALNRNGKARALPGTATDSQSLFAQHKREKVKQRVKILQMLVPNGNKADMAILFEQAYNYIKFLEQQIKLLKSDMDWKLGVPFLNNLSHPE